MFKKIILSALILLLLPIAVFAQGYPNALACFTTGDWSDFECVIGYGFSSLFGSPLYATIISLIFAVAFCYYTKMPLDLTALFILAFVWVGNFAFIPAWIFWLIVIILGSITGWGFYKLLKSR